MKKFLTVIFSALIFLGNVWADENLFDGKKVLLRVRLSELAITSNFNGQSASSLNGPLDQGLARGKSLDDYLEVSYPGVLYDPPVELSVVSANEFIFDTPLHAAQTEFSAYKSGDVVAMAECFVDDERSKLEKLLSDPQVKERHAQLFQSSSVRKVKGEIRYKGFVILFIKDSPDDSQGFLPVTYKETEQGFKRTNALVADEILDILMPMLREHKGEMKEI